VNLRQRVQKPGERRKEVMEHEATVIEPLVRVSGYKLNSEVENGTKPFNTDEKTVS
jgi:hypothetical protein